eukprot:1159279-Pelagomonas_calceolata.AAC.10
MKLISVQASASPIRGYQVPQVCCLRLHPGCSMLGFVMHMAAHVHNPEQEPGCLCMQQDALCTALYSTAVVSTYRLHFRQFLPTSLLGLNKNFGLDFP